MLNKSKWLKNEGKDSWTSDVLFVRMQLLVTIFVFRQVMSTSLLTVKPAWDARFIYDVWVKMIKLDLAHLPFGSANSVRINTKTVNKIPFFWYSNFWGDNTLQMY